MKAGAGRSRTVGARTVGVATIAAVLVGTAPATAQPPDTSALALPPLVVRGAPGSELLAGASGVRLRPDSLPFAAGVGLDRLLRESAALVRVRHNSRGEVEVALRGIESRQVAVLWDGVPLSLGWDHRVDLSLVPLDGVESVAVERGLPSLLSGPNVLAGGVVLRSAPTERPRPPRTRLRITRLDDGWAFGSTATSAAGPGVVRLALGHRRQEGWSLPAGLRDLDGGRRRLGSDAVQTNAAAVWRLGSDAGPWAQLSAAGLVAERGVPPELHTTTPRLWRYPVIRRLAAALGAGTGAWATPWGSGDAEATLGLVDGVTSLESYADAAYTRRTGREDAEERTLTARVLAEHTIGPNGTLRTALTHGEVRRHERLEPGGAARYWQRLTSVAVEAEARAGAWSLGLGAAWDRAASPGAGPHLPNPPTSAWGSRAVVRWLPIRGLVLHAGMQQRARFPSLRELYSGALGRFVPNPALGPERLRAAEAGARWRGRSWEGQAVAFHQRLDDAIVREGLGGGRFRRVNRDALRSVGLEALLGGRAGPLAWRLEGLRQWPRLREPGGTRPPEHQPAWLLGAEATLRLNSRLQGSLLTQHTGRQWCLSPETGRPVALGAHTRWDAGLRHAAGRRWPFEFRVDVWNLFDAKTFDQCGLPQPGRALQLQVDLVAP